MKSRAFSFVTAAAVLLIAFTLIFSPALQAQNAQETRLDSVHYGISTDISDLSSLDIEALQLAMTFGLTSINSLETVFHYDADRINLRGTWLVDFTEDTPRDLNLRLSLASENGLSGLEPALGLGGEFPAGDNTYIFGHLDYYFNISNSSLVYRGGVGIPLTVNSNLRLSAGNSFWNRDSHQLKVGMEIEL